MEVVDTLDFLLGSWQVARTIEDHRGSAGARFAWTATLRVEPARPGAVPCVDAGYDESGELRLGRHRGTARRTLRYVRNGGAVVVHFADGRPYVDLDLRGGRWEAAHLCGADRYEIATVVHSPDVVEERWRVTGPAKDYDAVTTLTRVALQEPTRPTRPA